MIARIIVGVIGILISCIFWGLIRADILMTQDFYGDWLRGVYLFLLMMGQSLITIAMFGWKQ